MINNGQLESPISHVSVNVTKVMPASEIVAKALISFDLVVRTLYSMFTPGLGGGWVELFYALAHTLLAYTTILCCVNTVKRGCCTPLFTVLTPQTNSIKIRIKIGIY